jgi:hypothetical protein
MYRTKMFTLSLCLSSQNDFLANFREIDVYTVLLAPLLMLVLLLAALLFLASLLLRVSLLLLMFLLLLTFLQLWHP